MAVFKEYSERYGREVWGYKAKIGGKRRRKFGFSSEEAATLALSKARLEEFDRRHGVAPPPERPSITVRQLVEKRKAQLQGSKSQKKSARLLERWLATLKPFMLVTHLTTAILQDWIDLRRKTVSHETVYREMTDICSCINRAAENFSALKDWQPPRRPRMKTPTKRRTRLISREEARHILAHLRRPREEGETERYWRVRCDAADLLQIALFTSARRQEIFNLRWTDVNFELMTLRAVDIKNGKEKIIPMVAGLAALLKRRKLAAGRSPLVFPCLAGKTMLRANTDQIYRKACGEIGLLYGRDVPGGWVLHDARHTAITAMLDAGYSLESVRRISGHSARVMAMIYAHTVDANVRATVSALEQFAVENVPLSLHDEGHSEQHSQRMQHAPRKGEGVKTKGKSKKSAKTRSARA
ncbi:MAG TPA: site-specific integrase [Pyrinomonadaceae bacterium]|nr:site-specific integrase [Pyrinomonadaceae bacterium]